MSEDARLHEIAGNLEALEQRVADACQAAGRDRADVTVVAVTKTFPAEDVVRLHRLGLRDMGENRHQEAADKAASCAGSGLTDLRWHFVGQLQTNKAGAVARYASVVHSVDRARLAHALERGAVEAGRVLDCLVQVDLRDPPVSDGRGGAAPADLPAIAAVVESAGHLRLRGVMAVAPLGADAAAAFAVLARLAADLRSEHPDLTVVSAGMSGDLEEAVATGATHLRVGSALLGSRPALR